MSNSTSMSSGPRSSLGSRHIPRWIRSAVAVLGLSTLVAGGGLQQDELDCEQAISYLQGCCPDFEGASVRCEHGGCITEVSPALSIDESQCIVGKSCADILSSGLCDRVRDLASPTVNVFDDAGTSHPPVCL